MKIENSISYCSLKAKWMRVTVRLYIGSAMLPDVKRDTEYQYQIAFGSVT